MGEMLSMQVSGVQELLARFDQLEPVFQDETATAMAEADRQMQTGLSMVMPVGARSPHMVQSMSSEVVISPVRVTGIVHIHSFWASWVDKGTKPHDIPVKGRIVHHPGAKAARFVAQARNLTRDQILNEFIAACQRIVQRLDTKS